MLDYAALARRPAAFRSLTGMTPAEFDALLADFAAAADRLRRDAPRTRRGTPRRRAAGAGRRHRHGCRGRLLLALTWLRVYPTYEVLGLLFGLHRGNACRNVAAALAVLDTLGDFPFDRPDRDPGRRPLESAAAVMDAFPAVRLVVDTKEQRCRRPGGWEAQKPYFSGKKRAHTPKNQLAVSPAGLVESVGDSVPGGSKHDRTLLKESGLLGRLGADEAAMADKAYEPLKRQCPDRDLITPLPARRGHPLTDQQKAANRFIARYRVVVEHTIAQLSRYTALRQVFRGSPAGHSRVLRVVAGVVNRRIRVKPLKTYPTAA